MNVLTALAVALAAVACSENEPVLEEDEVPTEPGLGPAERQRTSSERLGGGLKEDIDQFRRKTRDDLQLVVRDIESFEARVDTTRERAGAQYRDFTADLNSRAERLRLQLQNLEADTEAEFREEKARIEADLRRLEEDVDRLGRDDDAT